MPILPFSLVPGHWGLRGKHRERIKAEYELTGESLDRRLIEIDYDEDCVEKKQRLLNVDLKYNRITKEQYDYAIVELSGDPVEKLNVDLKYNKITQRDYEVQMAKMEGKSDEEIELKIAEIDFKHGLISQTIYDKTVATIKNEPYMGVIESNFRPDLGINGLTFEFEWNEQFIAMLVSNGYNGTTDEEIVNSYFNDLCRSVAVETGLFDEHEEIVQRGQRGQKIVRKNGDHTEHY